MDRRPETFKIEGPTQESKVEKKEVGKKEEENKFDYQNTKSKKFQKVNNEGSLNEKDQK